MNRRPVSMAYLLLLLLKLPYRNLALTLHTDLSQRANHTSGTTGADGLFTTITSTNTGLLNTAASSAPSVSVSKVHTPNFKGASSGSSSLTSHDNILHNKYLENTYGPLHLAGSWIACIVIGIVLLFVLMCTVAFFLRRRYKKRHLREEAETKALEDRKRRSELDLQNNSNGGQQEDDEASVYDQQDPEEARRKSSALGR
ncbi:MAG: hypothetical protein CYPHOPRED_002914 [Cyphobasidiales sp. Tagirdzhanova-0007]|nr:MAG: hypothetical protein CYPHOPRED_002914 [Cyphobasidiales sp. Tagirdzhanova-0007]